MSDGDMSNAEQQRLIDHAAIVQLTIDYCWALDTGDWDRLRTVFTPDATADLGANGQRGVDEIIARVSAALGPLDDSQHMVSNHQITFDDDGDGASGRCYLQAQHIRQNVEGEPLYMVAGRYEDRYVRTADGWRIADRRIVPMWRRGNTEVFKSARPTNTDRGAQTGADRAD